MQKKILTPIKSIRAKCLDCSAGSPKEVKECPVTGCALYPGGGHRVSVISFREFFKFVIPACS
jgi:hypothetical protein